MNSLDSDGRIPESGIATRNLQMPNSYAYNQ